MNTLDFVHLALLALGGSVNGKTNLQKKVYFLGVLTREIDGLGYHPHYYGPYSESVATSVEDLKAIGFVEQNVVSAFGVGSTDFERRRYDYRLTEAGRTAAESKCGRFPEPWHRLQEAAESLKEAGNPDYMKLSIAAKTFFLLGEQKKPATQNELARLAPRFGWRVSGEEINDAAKYLGVLGLVEIDAKHESASG